MPLKNIQSQTSVANIVLPCLSWFLGFTIFVQTLVHVGWNQRHPMFFAVEWVIYGALTLAMILLLTYRESTGKINAACAVVRAEVTLTACVITGATLSIYTAVSEGFKHSLFGREHHVPVLAPAAMYVSSLGAFVSSVFLVWTFVLFCYKRSRLVPR